MKLKDKEVEVIEEDAANYFAKINSCGLIGVGAYQVEIEINISTGLPNFILVGLPDTAINESKERVRAAIKSSNIEFPSKKIVVNLAPADTRKAGPTYDLPIAISILTASEMFKENLQDLEHLYIVGELGLSGKIRAIRGVLPYVMLAKQKNARGIIIPSENAQEASLIEEINIYPVSNLNETINVIKNLNNITPLKRLHTLKKEEDSFSIDLSEVKGQSLAKRALEICASGGHHSLMIGPPGSGKSMLAQRFTTILPPLTYEEKIETTQIYSISGRLNKKHGLVLTRPFRSPHHNISVPGLIGGSSTPQPGEISLAHKGILFLDEFTEFQSQVLDSLRQAIESKEITISRSRRSCTFPCDFTLIAACNPCPCGYLGDSIKKCSCHQSKIRKYQSKISGPILDRIDLQVEVKRLTKEELTSSKSQEPSKKVKERVIQARELQSKRYKDLNTKLNSSLLPKDIKHFCKTTPKAGLLIKDAIKTFELTARSYDRLLKVSRTIADLNNSDIIKDEHVLEALQFRMQSFIK